MGQGRKTKACKKIQSYPKQYLAITSTTISKFLTSHTYQRKGCNYKKQYNLKIYTLMDIKVLEPLLHAKFSSTILYEW
jgi:hypothetical protein